ncbi:MAG: caspase family protein [Rubrivivax sp.]|nr:caspase family protein [Rubrivivax sp.]
MRDPPVPCRLASQRRLCASLWRPWLLLAAATLALCQPSGAQAPVAREPAAPPEAQHRTALVIGNAAYETSPLPNAANDARAMARVLREAGFSVLLHTDIDQRQMQAALRDFGERLKAGGGTGLFYYAGHGMQIKGRNFLIPVRSHIAHEDEVAYAALDAQAVLDKMESAGNGTNILILDACRNNPFARSFRGAQQGLAQMDAPVGTLISFATAPGSVAIDNLPGQVNGLFTTHLLEAIRRPALKVEDVLKQVRLGVLRASRNRQVPWESSALVGDFYFHPPMGLSAGAPATAVLPTGVPSAAPPGAPTGPTSAAPSATAPATDPQAALDDALWEIVRESRSSAELYAYLNRFPAGRHARTARQRLLDLALPVASSPTPAPATNLPPPPVPTAPLDLAAAVRESSERLRREMVAARGPTHELAVWGDIGANVRSPNPARNTAGFSEGDRWRYLVTDLLGGQPMRGYVWRVDRVDADGGLWVNGGRQRLDAQGQRRSGNEEVTGVWLDFQPPLPIAQIAAGGPGRQGELAAIVQERDAAGAVVRHTLRGTWQTRTEEMKAPRGIEGSVLSVRVEFRFEGHTDHPGGRRAPAQWLHRYWMAQSTLLPLAAELEESESGTKRRHSLHELVAADILALDNPSPGGTR